MLADDLAPLIALAIPGAVDLRQALEAAHDAAGDTQSARVECHQCELQTFAFAQQQVLLRYLHIGESDDAILQGAQAHEMAASHHFHTLPAAFHDDCADLLGIVVAGHHHVEIGNGSVGAPELFAAQNVVAFGRACERGHQVCGVASHFVFGQRERTDGAFRDAWQVFGLLLRSAEKFEGLRHTDALVRAQ